LARTVAAIFLIFSDIERASPQTISKKPDLAVKKDLQPQHFARLQKSFQNHMVVEE